MPNHGVKILPEAVVDSELAPIKKNRLAPDVLAKSNDRLPQE